MDHLRSGVPQLAAALQAGEVFIHPWVVGEFACGNLRDRSRVLQLLQSLPSACVATPAEVLMLIEQHHLMGRGIGFVDAQLLATARLSTCLLWTQDRRLAVLAQEPQAAARFWHMNRPKLKLALLPGHDTCTSSCAR